MRLPSLGRARWGGRRRGAHCYREQHITERDSDAEPLERRAERIERSWSDSA